HPTAHVSEDAIIGEGTQIGAHSYVGEGVVIGAHCQVGQNVSIGANVVLGEAVIVEDGAAVLGPAWIEKGVHLFQGARVGDVPQTGQITDGVTFILHDCQVMSGARIARGVKVGPMAVVRPSAHVAEDVKPGWVVSGDPARLIFILDVEGATI
ncbi:MAG: hypothetical protein IMZ62_00455, partial [Chloroflexi bacterium]|nr:hypothetical protein [Chloroflexota bacterium]